MATDQFNPEDQRIYIDCDCTVAMCVIANIQLACRHEKNHGPSREIAERFARSLQESVGRMWPEVVALMEMGWHQEFDVE